jgi:phosphatidylserine decarboxylase
MKMRIHKEGWAVMGLVLLLVLIILVVINLIFPQQTIIHFILYGAAIIFYFFVVRFFRDPIREVVPDDNLVISGADGKVVVIEDVFEKEYFKDKRKQVSVFMSPLDIHVNWFPVSGKVKYFRHNHGFYFIASKPKSSDENERTTTVIELKDGTEILFRQIAGTVARRIVCYATDGKEATQGENLGIIKFGSRFDLFLPLDAKVDVRLGQKVTGCQTVMARLK